MAPGKKYFIDAHCHFFNIDDVPVSATIGRINFNRYKWFFPIVPFLDLNGIFKSFAAFFRFFERDIDVNLKSVTKEILDAGEFISDLDGREKIMTPLIMDFEKAGTHETLKGQTERLRAGVAAAERVLDGRKFRILPFLGVDMRRFDGVKEVKDVPRTVDRLLQSHAGPIQPPAVRKDIGSLLSGDILGVKLYPALGFNPYPDDRKIRNRYLAVYRHLHRLEFPITVHCQEDSYSVAGVSDRQVKHFTSPKNWEKVLREPGLKDLRINFAHFGGERQVKKAVLWEDYNHDDGEEIPFHRYRKNSWTYTIIGMLKKHPNAYSDLSAFDYGDRLAVLCLGWLLALDRRGKFDGLGPHALEDKLLWGSDTPMVLRAYPKYGRLFGEFYKAMDIRRIKSADHENPRRRFGAHIPKRNSLVEKFIDRNPRRFLFDD